ncbi:MAG: class I SAM-dependent methyltransferase [Deltaproteobacteria bacterium]|nr:class I SAM-dependent methyltransferase [Deltaproteobacteria bacterium]
MKLRDRIKPWAQDLAMRFMDDLRPDAVVGARGDVLEIGFGTGLNLRHYPSEVRAVWGIDPMATEGVGPVERRIAQAPFPVERSALRADDQLPFDSGRFDCVVTVAAVPKAPFAGRIASTRRGAGSPTAATSTGPSTSSSSRPASSSGRSTSSRARGRG